MTFTTKKKKLQGFKSIRLQGTEAPMAKVEKYLEDTFDQKFTWNPHKQIITIKAKAAADRCRRSCGKNWELSPKLTAI